MLSPAARIAVIQNVPFDRSFGIATEEARNELISCVKVKAGRSYEQITKYDLVRLAGLAAEDRSDFFCRNTDTGRLYSERLFAVALCQGAALHYIDGKNGVKDFDVWSFYRTHPERQFPPRRRGVLDFGDPKFGTSVDSPDYVGRRIDLIGRSISATTYSNPVAVLQAYLRGGRTESARRLSEKAMVLIEPSELLGVVVWPVVS